METQSSSTPSGHGFWKVFLAALFLGVFGIHRFLVGKIKTGIVQLLTLGGLGLWVFIDLVLILLGKFKDSKGDAIPNASPKASWVIFVIAIAIAAGGKGGGVGGGSNRRSDTKGDSSEGAFNPYDYADEITGEVKKVYARYKPGIGSTDGDVTDLHFYPNGKNQYKFTLRFNPRFLGKYTGDSYQWKGLLYKKDGQWRYRLEAD